MFAFSKEEILKRRAGLGKQKLPFDISKKYLSGVAGVLILVLSISIFIAFKKPNAYAVMLDGQQIAVVQDKELVDAALQKLAKENANLEKVHYQGKIDYHKVRVKNNELTDSKQLDQLLRKNLTFITQGTVITVGGQAVATVSSEAVAKEILEEVKNTYLPKENDSRKVADVKIEEAVAFKTVELPVGEISAPDKVRSLLLHGVEELQEYTVKEGDTLWTIARANGMSVEELQAANPDLKTEKLAIDQRLNLVKTKPVLNVVATINYKSAETIPFDIKVEKDSKMLRGQEKVKQAGVNGEREVEYKIVQRNGLEVAKEVIAEKILQKPVVKVVTKGTRVMLASRGEGGSGMLSWPRRDQITSGYGYRGREFHTGLDIDGDTGDPIYAAEDGVVIFAGWSGNYGYMVAVDHGDGLVTRYAHNSKNKVGVGDKVKRGEVIALVGDTGRSTGSHVHFEVMVNGNFQSPIRYLK